MESKTTDNLDEICAVCSETIDIYALGKCDHPVCFKCSTRMRVLCELNYCPICRCELQKVVFIKKIHKFASILTNHFPIERKHQIYFETSDIQTRYRELLQPKCSLCPKRPPDKKFVFLKDHMRKDHNLFYCDLCWQHIKVFPSERKCYSRQQLGEHRRKGDADDKSHKGHPLCKFCDMRYFDNDELHVHLRKDHYFCHFCDADGISNEYFSDYDILREHFREEHYLCEEAHCIEAKFTNAFRSDIDLKGHVAKEHSKTMKRSQAKQARTIDIEINYAPRQTAGRGGRGRHHAPVVSREDYDEHNRGGYHAYGRGGGGGGREGGGALSRHTNRARGQVAEREASDTQLAIQASLADVNQNVTVNVVRPVEPRKEEKPSDEFNHDKSDFPVLGKEKVTSKPSASVTSASKNDSGKDYFLEKSKSAAKPVEDFPALGASAAASKSNGHVAPVRGASAGPIARKGKNLSSEEDFPSLGAPSGVMPQSARSKVWNFKPPAKTQAKPLRQPLAFTSVRDFPTLKSGPTRQRTEITVPVGMRAEDFPQNTDPNSYTSIQAQPKMRMVKSISPKEEVAVQPRPNITNSLTVMKAKNASLEEDFPSLGGGRKKNKQKQHNSEWTTPKNAASSSQSQSKRNVTNSVTLVKAKSASLEEDDYPSLGGGKATVQQNNWVQAGKSKKQDSKQGVSKSKTPAPAPVIPKSKTSTAESTKSAASKPKNQAPAAKAPVEKDTETLDDSSSGKSKTKKKSKKKNAKTSESVPDSVQKDAGSTEKSVAGTVSELEMQVEDYTESSKKEEKEKQDSKTAELNINFLRHFVDDFPSLAALKDQSNLTHEKSVTFDLGNEVDDFPTLGISASAGSTAKTAAAPPPGFAKPVTKKSTPPPPPGFTNSGGGNRPPPGFSSAPGPFKTTLGTLINTDTNSENIAPAANGHSGAPLQSEPVIKEYVQPDDFKERNQQLILDIQAALRSGVDSFANFKSSSGKFRQGLMNGSAYYSNCLELLGEESFRKIFPELLVLLPDIDKQQELHTAHVSYTKSKDSGVLKVSKGKSRTPWGSNAATVLSVSSCPSCKQVLAKKDYNSHVSNHGDEEEFPSLAAGSNPYGLSAWVKAK